MSETGKNTSPLDDLIRNRISDIETPYQPEDWDEMEKLLSKKAKKKPRGAGGSGGRSINMKWIFIPLLLLAGGYGVYHLTSRKITDSLFAGEKETTPKLNTVVADKTNTGTPSDNIVDEEVKNEAVVQANYDKPTETVNKNTIPSEPEVRVAEEVTIEKPVKKARKRKTGNTSSNTMLAENVVAAPIASDYSEVATTTPAPSKSKKSGTGKGKTSNVDKSIDTNPIEGATPINGATGALTADAGTGTATNVATWGSKPTAAKTAKPKNAGSTTSATPGTTTENNIVKTDEPKPTQPLTEAEILAKAAASKKAALEKQAALKNQGKTGTGTNSSSPALVALSPEESNSTNTAAPTVPNTTELNPVKSTDANTPPLTSETEANNTPVTKAVWATSDSAVAEKETLNNESAVKDSAITPESDNPLLEAFRDSLYNFANYIVINFGGNPAYVGETKDNNISLGYHDLLPSQPFNQRPTTLHVAYETLVKKLNSGIGIQYSLFQDGNTSIRGINVSYSYTVFLREQVELSLGAALNNNDKAIAYKGLTFTDQLTDFGLLQTTAQDTSVKKVNYNQVNAGARFKYKKWFVGASVLNINQPNTSLKGTGSKLPMNYAVHTGYFIPLSKQFTVLPFVDFKMYDKVQLFTPSLLMSYKNRLVTGVSYKNMKFVGGHLGLNVKNIHLTAGAGISTDKNMRAFSKLGYVEGGLRYQFKFKR